jgi:PAS domain S-box-containing protein
MEWGMNLNRFGRPASLARITGLISLGAVASAVPAVLAIKRSLLTALPVAAQTAAATVTCGLVALVAVFARRTGSRAMAVSDVQELTTILAAPPLLGARPSGQGVITSDADGRLDYISAEAQAILGQSTASLAGKTIAEILEPFSTLPTEQGRRMITMVKPDGSTIFIEPIIAPIRDRRGNYVGSVVVLHDLSEVRMLANQLDWQATHDILTGLINRAEFERRIAAGIARSQEFGDPACLCLIDLDQFKIVNDLCGHAAGDKLLREVADLLGRHLRRSDIVARLSGDEFGLLLRIAPRRKASNWARSCCTSSRTGASTGTTRCSPSA